MAETEENRIRRKAREIGFDDVRMTTADPPGHADAMAAWLEADMQGQMGYLEKRAALRSGPLSSEALLAGAQSAVMVALSYDFPDATSGAERVGNPRGVVARYARGQDYHPIFWEKLNTLGGWMEAEWPGTRTRGFADSGPLRERELAARAGMGWQGRHTNLISLELGNWFFLGVLLTTLPLRPDPPLESGGHCGTCTRCLSACPTGALVAPLTLDARRCISYLTIELKGAIPRELRPLIGNRIFGCDDCLAACPWNDRPRQGQEMRLAARDTEAAYPDLLLLLELLADEKAFQARFAGTPLLRSKREGLRRNVCVALGNIGRAESIDPLSVVLASDPSPLVRGHAAWALGEIAHRTGNSAARAVLADALKNETEESVREEIVFAVD